MYGTRDKLKRSLIKKALKVATVLNLSNKLNFDIFQMSGFRILEHVLIIVLFSH